MEKVTFKCPAKINLSLDIVGEREDGYHLLKMIMQSVSLYDEITVKRAYEEIVVYSNNPDVPCDHDNICYKTAKLMKDILRIDNGFNIYINKKIPIAAGLAGGSSDAAGVILAIDELCNLKLSLDEMMKIGVKVGADVPFCLKRGTALAEGIGEIITPLPQVNGWVVLAKPDKGVSTAEVFSKFRSDEVVRHPETDKLIEYICNGDLYNLAQNMINVLETVTLKKLPVLLEIKNIMAEFHALGSLMSGSGPTVFGLFEDRNSAEKCYHRLGDYLKEVYLVKTVSN